MIVKLSIQLKECNRGKTLGLCKNFILMKMGVCGVIVKERIYSKNERKEKFKYFKLAHSIQSPVSSRPASQVAVSTESYLMVQNHGPFAALDRAWRAVVPLLSSW